MKCVHFKLKEGWEIPGRSLPEPPPQNQGVGVGESRALLWGLKCGGKVTLLGWKWALESSQSARLTLERTEQEVLFAQLGGELACAQGS